MIPSQRKLATVLTLVALTAALPHCARDVMLDGPPPPPTEAGAGPTFVAPDSGDAALADAGLPVAMCASTECPEPYTTCSAVPLYRCETNLSNDSNNCGACGNSCLTRLPASLHTELTCVGGECRAICWPKLYLDCNHVVDDGCEVDPRIDPANCGGCGLQCPSGVRCVAGQCGCPPGEVDCNGACKDLAADDANCGSCGYECTDHSTDAGSLAPHMVFGCWSAQCAAKCETSRVVYWANCNGLPADGCEVNLNGDNDNCGQCGKKCPPGKSCYAIGSGPIDCHDPPGSEPCPGGRTRCDGICVDLDGDALNCGSCGFVCPDPVVFAEQGQNNNGQPICDRARCGYACRPGFADCNGRPEDGCEAPLSKDPHHCGACGISCDNAIGQPCVNGECATKECDAGKVVQ